MQACVPLQGKGWPLSSLVCCVIVTFPYGVPGQVWYLIALIPDVLLFFGILAQIRRIHLMINLVKHVKTLFCKYV